MSHLTLKETKLVKKKVYISNKVINIHNEHIDNFLQNTQEKSTIRNTYISILYS